MISDNGTSTAKEVDEIAGLYIVENPALEHLLFDRNLMGIEFRRACAESSRLMVGHLLDELDPDVTELVILGKGLAYQLASAFDSYGLNLPTNLLATSRKDVEGDSASVVVSYRSLDAAGDSIIIGDTVASGATVVTALNEYRKVHEVRRLHLLSFAGAVGGARVILDYCRRHAIQAKLLYGLAAFGLAKNGFDLSFLHPDTLTKDAYRQRAAEQFNSKPVSAVGWDFGSQYMAPDKYRALSWVEAEIWGLRGHESLAIASRPRSFSVVSKESDAFAGMAEYLRDPSELPPSDQP
ncbi:hypothetical protein [Catellatospora paridis]|uniref:hypothetical protein n=1 Tax=Catellatospora paridis TaxID=1617086 RepID=UPI0012D412CD|nr:hypothetical protein [Catellatospora paridis]